MSGGPRRGSVGHWAGRALEERARESPTSERLRARHRESGACTTTMTELLVESTDGLVHHSQFTKLRFTELGGEKKR